MADPLPIPQPSALNDAKGQTTTHGFKYFQSLDQSARAANANLASLQGSLGAVTDTFSVLIASPANQDYLVWVNIPYDITVETMTTIAASGTCTLVAKKNTTAITGLSNSVSTSEVTNTATAGNVFAAGDDLRLTVSATSACSFMSVTIKFQRAVI